MSVAHTSSRRADGVELGGSDKAIAPEPVPRSTATSGSTRHRHMLLRAQLVQRDRHHHLGLGPGDEDTRLDSQLQRPKRPGAEHVLQGLSRQTPVDHGPHGICHRRCHDAVSALATRSPALMPVGVGHDPSRLGARTPGRRSRRSRRSRTGWEATGVPAAVTRAGRPPARSRARVRRRAVRRRSRRDLRRARGRACAA